MNQNNPISNTRWENKPKPDPAGVINNTAQEKTQ